MPSLTSKDKTHCIRGHRRNPETTYTLPNGTRRCRVCQLEQWHERHPPKPRPTLADRFWAKVKKSRGCWTWTARTEDWGYGTLKVDGRTERAHRVSWTLHFGPIPAGASVLHKCDNPPCVRPDHLYLGTDADNTKDKMERGRMPSTAGEANGRAKLTRKDVQMIRSEYAKGQIRQVDLAERYGVCQAHISEIVREVIWN